MATNEQEFPLNTRAMPPQQSHVQIARAEQCFRNPACHTPSLRRCMKELPAGTWASEHDFAPISSSQLWLGMNSVFRRRRFLEISAVSGLVTAVWGAAAPSSLLSTLYLKSSHHFYVVLTVQGVRKRVRFNYCGDESVVVDIAELSLLHVAVDCLQ